MPLGAHAQTDSLPATEHQIATCRQEIIRAFLHDDQQEARVWMDSLRRLEDNDYLTTQWDERWLLYYWTENYSPLFQEVARFSNAGEEANSYKVPPPADSLFDRLDSRIFAERESYFLQLQQAALPAEESEFVVLLLEYLLRISTQESETESYDARLNQFLSRYPKTRFSGFIHKRMYNTAPPGNWALGADVLFLRGNWTDMLERNLRTCYGADLGLSFWKNRWSLFLRVPVGFQKLANPIEEKGYIWEKDESSVYFGIELETGYDLYNKSRLRILPTVGGGFSSLHPPEGTEENPNPDYFDFFKFRSGHLTTAVQADVKFKAGTGKVATTYQGVRVRLGIRWINFGKQNPGLRGNMFFFAVGYTLFGRQPQIQY